jgi:hypothetical protein
LTGEVVVLISISFGFPLPDAGRLLMPNTKALLQEKIVPGVKLVGLYENAVLLQVGGGFNELVRMGIGFTMTTTLYGAELHPPPDKM